MPYLLFFEVDSLRPGTTLMRCNEFIRRRSILFAIAAILIAGLTLALIASGLQPRDLATTVLLTSLIPPVCLFALMATVRGLAAQPLRPVRNLKSVSSESRLELVVPVILLGPRSISDLVACVDRNRAAVSPEPVIVLVDLPDAEVSHHPNDAEILDDLRLQLQNAGLLASVKLRVRERRFDQVNGCWIGWERKRGKTIEYLKFRLGDVGTSFGSVPLLGATPALVLTLDVDGTIDRDSVSRLLEVERYGCTFVAPSIRTVATSPSSWFQALAMYGASEPTGYSDRQLAFGRDVYEGKGLIDVARYLERLEGVIPESRVLSHDHLESGLAGAVSTFTATISEPCPLTRGAWAKRQMRWIRGDFQLLGWIFNHRVSGVGKLKLLENILIHLNPVCLSAALVTALGIGRSKEGIIAMAMVVLFLRPHLAVILVDAIMRRFGPPPLQRSRESMVNIALRLIGQWMIAFIYLGRDTLLTLRASSLALWRLYVTKRNLLEWNATVSNARKCVVDLCQIAVALLLVNGLFLVQSPIWELGFFVIIFGWLLLPIIIDVHDTRVLSRL